MDLDKLKTKYRNMPIDELAFFLESLDTSIKTSPGQTAAVTVFVIILVATAVGFVLVSLGGLDSDNRNSSLF